MPETRQQVLQTGAGHAGGISASQVFGERFIDKKTNHIEAIAYLELYQENPTNRVMPNIVGIKIGEKWYNVSPQELSVQEADQEADHEGAEKPFIPFDTFIKENLKDGNDKKIQIAIERFTCKNKPCDVKLGKKTYFPNWLRELLSQKSKTLVNQMQMNSCENLARLGGAKSYQIANSSNSLIRQFSYSESHTVLIKYFSGLSVEDLKKIEAKLGRIKNFIKKNNIIAVGASLLYHDDDVDLIDLANYVSKSVKENNFQHQEDFNKYNKNLLDSIDEQLQSLKKVKATKEQKAKSVVQISPDNGSFDDFEKRASVLDENSTSSKSFEKQKVELSSCSNSHLFDYFEGKLKLFLNAIRVKKDHKPVNYSVADKNKHLSTTNQADDKKSSDNSQSWADSIFYNKGVRRAIELFVISLK